jgi:Flp pilus assembly protein TadG
MKFIRTLLEADKGSAAVEMGIVFPIFALLILSVAGYGMMLFQMMEVNYATLVGADYAFNNQPGFNAGNISNAVTNATGLASISANPAPSQFCGCASLTGVSNVGSPPCTGTCTGGTTTAGLYVSVSAQAAYSPVMPGITSPITSTQVVRIQ